MVRPLESKARELIGLLDQDKLTAVVQLLERLVEMPEAVTDEDRRRVQEGAPFFAAGKGVPMEEVLADFGLTLDDFPAAK